MPRPYMAHIDRPLKPKEPLYVRRPFTANGHRFGPGDEFPWRNLAVDLRRVRQLFEQGKISHDEEGKLRERGLLRRAPHRATQDELEHIDSMPELREIAEREGAPFKVSKADQRKAIRDHRVAQSATDEKVDPGGEDEEVDPGGSESAAMGPPRWT